MAISRFFHPSLRGRFTNRLWQSVSPVGQDIVFEFFGTGYSFLINNPKCKSIASGETVIPVTEVPFVYDCPFAPNEYFFLDQDGNEIN